jgi:hypothetical protein
MTSRVIFARDRLTSETFTPHTKERCGSAGSARTNAGIAAGITDAIKRAVLRYKMRSDVVCPDSTRNSWFKY